MLIANIAINILGILIFLFIFWKRLKEDYSSELIFKSAFSVIFAVCLMSLISLKFFSSWTFWLSFFVGVLVVALSVYRFKLRFYEVFEALVLGTLPWLSLIYLGNSVFSYSLSSFFGFVATLIFIFVFYFLDDHYKSFSWYKSGRVGFSGLTTLSLLFLVRFVIAICKVGVLFFVSSKFEIGISATLFLTSIFLIYKLSKNEH